MTPDHPPAGAGGTGGSDGAVDAPAAAIADGPTMLLHNRVRLALHRLRDGPADGPRLLCLHGLGEATPRELPAHLAAWPGPVWGLDFTGHGHSTVPVGGGYTAELLMADVDLALAEIGPATVLGRGLGAYVALLIGGARPGLACGAILDDGPGLAGGGDTPGTPIATVLDPPAEAQRSLAGGADGAPVEGPEPSGAVPATVGGAPNPVRSGPDPFALSELARDVRPPDYALTYARLALQRSELERPVTVTARVRPPWLAAVADEPGVAGAGLVEALADHARQSS